MNLLKAHAATLELVKAVAALVQSYKTGSNYETMNPNVRGEVKDALSLLARLMDADDILDVDCETIISEIDAMSAKDEDLYVVVHQHGHGDTTYLVKCQHDPSEEEIVKTCSIDYEPEAGESLIIAYHAPWQGLQTVPTIGELSEKAPSRAKAADGLSFYMVVHEHRHGLNTYLVRCDHAPSEDEVIKACDIDFERDDDNPREFLTIDLVNPDDVTTIPPAEESEGDIECPHCQQYLVEVRTETILGIDRKVYQCPECHAYFIKEVAEAGGPLEEAVGCEMCRNLTPKASVHHLHGTAPFLIGDCCWDERFRD